MVEKSQYKSLAEWRKSDLSSYNAARKQGFLKEICDLFGWKLIPKKIFWTKEKCVVEAKKNETRLEWRKNSYGSYDSAKRKGWLPEICDLCNWEEPKKIYCRKPNGYWGVLENCMIEAKKHNTLTKWRKANLPSYEGAKNNGHLNECTKHMTIPKIGVKYWTLERCKEDALKHSGRWEWQKSKGGYNVAKTKGWLDICCEHMPQRKKWTYEEVKKIALKYEYASDWEHADPLSYSIASTNGWYEDLTAHMGRKIKKLGYWNNKELCKKIIATCNSKEEVKKHHGVFNSIRRNGWYKELTAHFKPATGFWNKETLLEEANKYETIKDFKDNSNGAYQTAIKLDCKDYVTQNLISNLCKPKGYWTKERILAESIKYTTRTQFIRAEPSAYRIARQLGIIDEVCSHMIVKRKVNNERKIPI